MSEVTNANPWADPETVTYATECYLDGKSAAEVARELKRKFGVVISRNAVIGKLNRIGVAQKRAAQPSAPKPVKTNTRYVAPKGAKAPAVRKTHKQKLKAPFTPVFKVVVAGNGATFVHDTRPARLKVKTPPAEIAVAPRHWESRRFGECAFPINDDLTAIQSCCNPCGAATYCPAHKAIMRPRNIHGTPQKKARPGNGSASSSTGVWQTPDMSASPTSPPVTAPKPADAWVSIGAAAQAVLAKLKVAS